MTYEVRINSDQGLYRLPTQFDNSPLLRDYLETYLLGVDSLQDATEEVLAGLRIDTAIGVQLDNIGEIVGEDRLAKSDEDYRIAIKTRIVLNSSQGLPADIYAAARALASSDTARFWEHYPASVIVSVGGENLASIPASIASELDKAAAAGVSIDQVLVDTNNDGLVFAEILLEDGTIQTDDGSDLVNESGDFIGYQIITTSTLSFQASLFAEIAQANLVVDQTYNQPLEVNSQPLIVNGQPYETGTVKYVLNGLDWIVTQQLPDITTGNIFFEVLT